MNETIQFPMIESSPLPPLASQFNNSSDLQLFGINMVPDGNFFQYSTTGDVDNNYINTDNEMSINSITPTNNVQIPIIPIPSNNTSNNNLPLHLPSLQYNTIDINPFQTQSNMPNIPQISIHANSQSYTTQNQPDFTTQIRNSTFIQNESYTPYDPYSYDS
eukprot:22296_1